MKDLWRKRVYALQQRLALTGPEAMALLGIAALLALGGLVNHVESKRSPVEIGAYAALDVAIAEGASRSIEEVRERVARDSAAVGVAGPSAEPPAAVSPAGTQRSLATVLPPVRMEINSASAAYLQRLPGIGPALAGRIVEYRELHGPFRSPTELMRVRGIGPKTYERLERYVFVAQVRSATAEPTDDQGRSEGSTDASEPSGAPSPP